jgi:hypothetical protein
MSTQDRSFDQTIAPEILECISWRELLIRHLGHWPSFHDFEVILLTLERAVVAAVTHDLRATFFVFGINKSPDDPERKQGTAEILFESIEALHIDGFNHQNPIMGVSILPSEPLGFKVVWGGTCMHHEVSFTYGRIAILHAVDLNPFSKTFPCL